MEATERAATEVDPLKRGEEGGEPGPGVPTPPAEQKKKGVRFAKLSHWRTAVFFLSLFLCLTIVFAFSFIIPCPVRPQYLSAWNRTFGDAATYDFLSIEDATKDKVMDVLFVLKDKEVSENITCAIEGLPSPCLFMVAVDGTDGETLWERPLAAEFHWAECGLAGDTGRDWDCLLSHADQITAIDKYTGQVQWQWPQPAGLSCSLPVLSAPDLDGDGVSEVVLVAPGALQTQLLILSGKTGVQVGSTVVLDAAKTTRHLLHSTNKGSDYVLLQEDSGLYGLALWRIAAQVRSGAEAGLKKDRRWEDRANATSGLVPIYQSDSVRHVLRTGKSLLLVSNQEVAMLSGDGLQPLWRVNTSTVLSEPSFGHFNKDGILDVVVEEDTGNNTKRVLILDGQTGGRLWQVSLMASLNSPRPASINTINSFSVFMFWGLMSAEANSSVPVNEDRRSYMLHPHYSKVLLESTNVMDHIIAFKATLLERGRHACYIVLTGPQGAGVRGPVVLSKRKLKQDVPGSRVLRTGTGGSADTDDAIKETFNRLRFSDD